MAVSPLVHGTRASAPATVVPPASVAPAGEAARALRRLVDLAAGLELADQTGMAHVQAQGHVVTARLVAAGHLPAHLVVELDDPPVVALRTLAAAARRQGAR